MTARVLPHRYAMVPVAEIQPRADNPNVGDVDAIGDSIDAIGFYGVVLVHEQTGDILAGEHRWRAAQAVGLAELPAIVVDCDDETARRIMVGDNEFARLGRWDVERLIAVLGPLAATPAGLAATGFSAERFAAMVGGGQPPGPLVYSAAQIIDVAFAWYREHGFPLVRIPAHVAMQEINSLASTETAMLPNTTTGYRIADGYHPQRWDVVCVATSGDLLSPRVAFGHDHRLRHALELLVAEGRPITDLGLSGMISWVHSTQAAAQFRPGFALYQMRRHGAAGGRMLDTSAGWGGRLVGYAASELAEYVGIDPSADAIGGNRKMSDDLGIGGVTLVQSPAEDVELAELGGAGSFDFALTSPPYFGKERYSDDPSQSYRRWPTGDQWRAGFLVPMIRLQFAALRPGGVAVLNIADVSLRGKTYPLARWARSAAADAGFDVSAEAMPMPRAPGRGVRPAESEPVLILRKPSGLRSASCRPKCASGRTRRPPNTSRSSAIPKCALGTWAAALATKTSKSRRRSARRRRLVRSTRPASRARRPSPRSRRTADRAGPS